MLLKPPNHSSCSANLTLLMWVSLVCTTCCKAGSGSI